MIPLGLTGLCAVLFVIGVALHSFKVSRKAAPWCFLLAGISGAGALGTAQGKVAGVVMDASQGLMSTALGAGALLATAAFLGIYLWSRMVKGGGGGKITCGVAYIYPPVLTAVGLGILINIAGDGMTMANSAFGSLVAGLGG